MYRFVLYLCHSRVHIHLWYPDQQLWHGQWSCNISEAVFLSTASTELLKSLEQILFIMNKYVVQLFLCVVLIFKKWFYHFAITKIV